MAEVERERVISLLRKLREELSVPGSSPKEYPYAISPEERRKTLKAIRKVEKELSIGWIL